MATIVEGNPKAPFSIATTPMCRGRRYSFPGLLYFTLDPYLIMLSVKQGGIKYHFFESVWLDHFLSRYDSTWDWTQVSRVQLANTLTPRPMSGITLTVIDFNCLNIYAFQIQWKRTGCIYNILCSSECSKVEKNH